MINIFNQKVKFQMMDKFIRKRSLKRTQSEMFNPIAMSTPAPRRLSSITKNKRLSQLSGISQLSTDSISDWSILTDKSNRSRISSVSQNLRFTKNRMTKKLKTAKTRFRSKMQNKCSKTHIEEIPVPHWPANKSFDKEKSQRIVSKREDLTFEEYDMVVWEASPEKKKRRKIFDLFKKSKKTSK